MMVGFHYTDYLISSVSYSKQRKILPITGHEGPCGGAVDRGGWLMPRPDRFTSEKDMVSTVQAAGWASGPFWTGVGNLTPNCSTRSQSQSSLTVNIILFLLQVVQQHITGYMRGAPFTKMRKLSFCVPLVLANDIQTKNFTVVIPTDYGLDIILLVEFIRGFRRTRVFWTNQVQVAWRKQLVLLAKIAVIR